MLCIALALHHKLPAGGIRHRMAAEVPCDSANTCPWLYIMPVMQHSQLEAVRAAHIRA